MAILEDIGWDRDIELHLVAMERRPDRGTRARLSPDSTMPHMEAGYTPFNLAQAIANGVVDVVTLAASIYATPSPSTHGLPSAGVDVHVNHADHDHGLAKGPPTMDLAIAYSAPGIPTGATRTDTPGGLISTTTITYAGARIASVVVVRPGYTITMVPTYTGTDITAIHRTVA